MMELLCELQDSDLNGQPALPLRVAVSLYALEVGAAGYGDHDSIDGDGSPIFLEVHEGRLRLLVWADINQEDPTHVIDLEGARESARKEGQADAE